MTIITQNWMSTPDEISYYRSMIGSENWILTLGRFDVAYTLSTLLRYSMAPREGRSHAMVRLFAYLMTHNKGMLFIDPTIPGTRKQAKVSSGQNWSAFYLDSCEDIPDDILASQGKLAHLTFFADADHARDKVTRRSVTGIELLANNTPISWLSKRQKTVETSSYGSKFAAAQRATDVVIEWKYKLWMLAVQLKSSSWMVGGNMSVVVNTTISSNNLKKRPQACNHHQVREAIAGRFMTFGHIGFEKSWQIYLTNHWLVSSSIQLLDSTFSGNLRHEGIQADWRGAICALVDVLEAAHYKHILHCLN